MKYSGNTELFGLFINIVDAYPTKVAVVCGDDSITFSKLYEEVLKVMEKLKNSDELRVYIKNERNIETIINILAAVGVSKPYRIYNELSEVSKDEINSNEYILYEVKTSGTTGESKIIGREVKEFTKFIKTYIEKFNITSDDVILNQLEFTFDASSKDIYSMMITGATLCIGARNKMNLPLEFIETVKKYNVTVFQTTPFFIKNMAKLRAFETGALDSIKTILFVGDVLKAKYLNYWIENLPETNFVNQYGVSERAGIILYSIINKLVDTEYVPLTDKFYDENISLDENGQLCIYDSLDGLVEKLEDTFSYSLDEGFVFTGRVDNIRKIRGYRISLEEIDNEICKIDGVLEALSEIVEDEVYVIYEGKELPIKEIKIALKKNLPSYCQPVHILKVSEIPVNSNGKRDRKQILEYFKK